MKTIILATALLAGCATVRQADLDAWKGVPLVDLESHPLFASMERETRALSDGSKLIIYFNGGSAAAFGSGMVTTGMRGCSNQFLVKDGQVVRYTPVGVGGVRCMTNCSVRPASNPCQ